MNVWSLASALKFAATLREATSVSVCVGMHGTVTTTAAARPWRDMLLYSLLTLQISAKYP